MTIEELCQVAHDSNRIYCEALGDYSHPLWRNATGDQKTSTLASVLIIKNNSGITPKELHERWMDDRIESGWIHGEHKNTEKKEHPCIVPFTKLPEAEQVKDTLRIAVVKALLPFLSETLDTP